MSQNPSILKNISWLGTGHAVSKPLWFIFITAFCMRALGAEEYGVMSAALALMAIAVSFTDLGIGQYSIKEIARNPQSASVLFSNFLALRAGLAVVAFAAAIGLGITLGYAGTGLFVLGMAGIFAIALSLTEFCRAILRAFEKFRNETVSVIGEKAIVIGAGVAGYFMAGSLLGLLAGMAVGMTVVFIANLAWVGYRCARPDHRHLSLSVLSKALPYALPLGLAGLFTMLYYRTDVVMIEAIRGEGDAGLYSAAFRILEGLILFPTVVVAVIFPRLSALYGQGSSNDFRTILRKSIGGMASIALIVAGAIAAAATGLIGVLDPSPEFQPSAGILQLLVWTFPVMSINYVLSIAFITTDQHRLLCWVLGLAVPFNIALNLALIPPYTYYGAAFTTLLTQVFILIALGAMYTSRVAGVLTRRKLTVTN